MEPNAIVDNELNIKKTDVLSVSCKVNSRRK